MPGLHTGPKEGYTIDCTSAGTIKDLAGNKEHWTSDRDVRVMHLYSGNRVPCYHSHEWMIRMHWHNLSKGGSPTCSAAFHFGMLKDLMTPLNPEFKRAVEMKKFKRNGEDILFCYDPDSEKWKGETLIFYHFAYNKSEGKLYELLVDDKGKLERSEWKNFEDKYVGDDGWYQDAKFDPSNILVRSVIAELPKKPSHSSSTTKCLYQKYVELESLRF